MTEIINKYRNENYINVNIEDKGDSYLIKIEGVLSIANMNEFKYSVLENDYEKKDIILDIENVSYIDSSGTGALIALNDLTKTNGNKMILRHPKKRVMELLQTLSLHKVFNIEDNCE